MTRREICERLIHTRDIMASLAKIVAEDRLPFNLDEVGKCGDFLRDLLLDIAAPEEEEPKADAPKSEEPPLLLYEEKGEKVPCPVCGEPAAPIKNKPGEVYCKLCGRCQMRRPKNDEA